MFKSDLTTKVFLALIALFLGILVCKSVFQGGAGAVAQAATQAQIQTAYVQNNPNAVTKNADDTVFGYRTVGVSVVKFNAKDKVIGVQVIDSAQSFLVQYSDRLEVFRVDSLPLGVTPSAQ